MSQCPACKETLLDGATVCRFCGRKIASPLGRGCFAFVAVILLIGAVGAILTPIIAPQSANNTPGADSKSGSSKTIQEDFERVNPSFVAAVAPCQIGFTAAGKALHTGDRYGAYDVVQRAQQACVNAWENANTTKYSTATPQPVRDKLNADLDDCSHAYAQYGGVLITIGNVLNGDERPSVVSQASHGIGLAVNQVSDCMHTYATDLRAAGVKLPGDLQKRARKARVPR